MKKPQTPVLPSTVPGVGACSRRVLLAWPLLATWPGVHADTRADTRAHNAACPTLWSHTVDRLQDEKPQDLCQFAGRVVMVVNTASFCGFTPQYRSLEAVYERYRARGLVVLGFPSNDFGQQEPGTHADIAELCENSFGVRFPMFVKTVVRGPQAHPLFQELARRSGQSPGWNFHKYLVDRQAKSVWSFASQQRPDGPVITQTIERLLQGKM